MYIKSSGQEINGYKIAFLTFKTCKIHTEVCKCFKIYFSLASKGWKLSNTLVACASKSACSLYLALPFIILGNHFKGLYDWYKSFIRDKIAAVC